MCDGLFGVFQKKRGAMARGMEHRNDAWNTVILTTVPCGPRSTCALYHAPTCSNMLVRATPIFNAPTLQSHCLCELLAPQLGRCVRPHIPHRVLRWTIPQAYVRLSRMKRCRTRTCFGREWGKSDASFNILTTEAQLVVQSALQNVS